ncbi:MAG: hypothetical protein LBD82_01295 [Deltaproteobacteria bacterium]|jgi:hypothetical protein|nr:hypothetical protein [Deltaproteobacteria bacterium]
MHASEKTIAAVLDELVKIIQSLYDFSSTEEQNKQEAMPGFYSSLSESLFKIVSTLKTDLYGPTSNPIAKEKMNNILKECKLFVETEALNGKKLQLYFWDELRNQLKNKGYNTIDTEKNFAPDVNEYYARVRNRHIDYGFDFEIYKLQDNTPVMFRIGVDNKYYYGFPRWLYENVKEENKTIISQCVDKMIGFKSDPHPLWFGWRYSPNYPLDFWNLRSEGFNDLKDKDPRKREKYIKGIANEIDMYIKEFRKIAKEQNI